MHKKTVSFLTAAVIAGTILTVPSAAYAATTTQNPFSSFIQSLAQKLGITQDKVQSAVDTLRTERQKEMQKLYEEKLTQAVKEGKLTEAQKKLLLEKHASLKNQFDADWKKRQDQRNQLQDWLEKNNIDPQYLFGGYGRMGGGKGQGMQKEFGGRGMMWR